MAKHFVKKSIEMISFHSNFQRFSSKRTTYGIKNQPVWQKTVYMKHGVLISIVFLTRKTSQTCTYAHEVF